MAKNKRNRIRLEEREARMAARREECVQLPTNLADRSLTSTVRLIQRITTYGHNQGKQYTPDDIPKWDEQFLALTHWKGGPSITDERERTSGETPEIGD